MISLTLNPSGTILFSSPFTEAKLLSNVALKLNSDIS